jgi:hypothetical protein
MNVDTEARRLLGEAGLAGRGPLAGDAAEYLRRTRRGRRYGLIGGLVLGFGPLAGDPEFSLVFPRMLAGYVLGLLISEVLAPRRVRSAHRAADLRVRRARDLLPRWAQPTVWLLFLPVFAAPLLALAHPVPGLSHVSRAGYSCAAGPGQWPGPAVLATAAAIGAVGLLAAQLTLTRLARRPRPADDPDGAGSMTSCGGCRPAPWPGGPQRWPSPSPPGSAGRCPPVPTTWSAQRGRAHRCLPIPGPHR